MPASDQTLRGQSDPWQALLGEWMIVSVAVLNDARILARTDPTTARGALFAANRLLRNRFVDADFPAEHARLLWAESKVAALRAIHADVRSRLRELN